MDGSKSTLNIFLIDKPIVSRVKISMHRKAISATIPLAQANSDNSLKVNKQKAPTRSGYPHCITEKAILSLIEIIK